MSIEDLAALKKFHEVIGVEIERQRLKLFSAMALVKTTERALGTEEERYDERDTLEMAYGIMDKVAGELNAISGHNGPLPEDEDAEAGT